MLLIICDLVKGVFGRNIVYKIKPKKLFFGASVWIEEKVVPLQGAAVIKKILKNLNYILVVFIKNSTE